MRLGVIGTGGIARRHIESLADQSIRFVHLATSMEKAQAFARDVAGTPDNPLAFDDLDAFVRDGKPDAVIVTVPPHRHGEIENRLINDAIPFLVEKPLSADRITAERIAEAIARRGNLVVGVGYHWRALEPVPAVRAALAGRSLRLVAGRFHVGLPKASWWRRQDESGGQFNEQACHLVDLARTFAGEAVVLYAAGHAFARPQYPGADVLPASAAMLRFAGGALGVFSAVNTLERPGPIEFDIAADGVDIRLTLSDATISTADGFIRHGATKNPYRTQNLAFLDAVARGDRNGVYCTYEDALLTHRLCQEITEAALAHNA